MDLGLSVSLATYELCYMVGHVLTYGTARARLLLGGIVGLMGRADAVWWQQHGAGIQ